MFFICSKWLIYHDWLMELLRTFFIQEAGGMVKISSAPDSQQTEMYGLYHV